jgi:hypothetical protein
MMSVCSIRVFLFWGQRAKHKWVSWDEEIRDDSGYADHSMNRLVSERRAGPTPRNALYRDEIAGHERSVDLASLSVAFRSV